ncbi:hypothetical protein PIB30_069893 [Stylosanthes scabra]|nr:hypothetical protein [Stylosanthes scabra]
MRGESEFVAELASLANIRHQNLVRLRGCCVEGARRYLVYDYMHNNSVYHTCLCSQEGRIRFKWEARRQVSRGVAHGLAYLHHQLTPHLVHRDIKPTNILLDSNFLPNISDFGLAKLFTDDKSYITTKVAGTLGYLAPEYATSGQVTRKSDVYSFGVLLLQIVTGLPAVDAYQDIDRFIVEKAWKAYEEKDLIRMVDPTLNNMNVWAEEVVRFLKVGLLCVQETTKLRPTMLGVVEMLTNDNVDMEDIRISKPGFVADLRNIRIKKQEGAINSSKESSYSGAASPSSIFTTTMNVGR